MSLDGYMQVNACVWICSNAFLGFEEEFEFLFILWDFKNVFAIFYYCNILMFQYLVYDVHKDIGAIVCILILLLIFLMLIMSKLVIWPQNILQ